MIYHELSWVIWLKCSRTSCSPISTNSSLVKIYFCEPVRGLKKNSWIGSMSVVKGQSSTKRLYKLALPICQSLIVWSFRASGELWVRRVRRLIGQNSFCGKQNCVHYISRISKNIFKKNTCWHTHNKRERREQMEWRWGGKREQLAQAQAPDTALCPPAVYFVCIKLFWTLN